MLSESFEDGSTLRDQLESVWRQTGRKPKELENLIQLPESCYQVWKWFLELNAARTGSGFGVNPITYTEIHCYMTLMQITPEEWEISLIRRFDNEAMKASTKKSSSKSSSKKKSK